jgi:hypothetical protein
MRGLKMKHRPDGEQSHKENAHSRRTFLERMAAVAALGGATWPRGTLQVPRSIPNGGVDLGSEKAADLGMRFNHHTAAVNGVRLNFVTGGEGKPVLLLHGWPQTWWEWRRILPARAKRFTAEDRRRNTMDTGWKSARVFIALVLLYTCWSACQSQTNVALAQGR